MGPVTTQLILHTEEEWQERVLDKWKPRDESSEAESILTGDLGAQEIRAIGRKLKTSKHMHIFFLH